MCLLPVKLPSSNQMIMNHLLESHPPQIGRPSWPPPNSAPNCVPYAFRRSRPAFAGLPLLQTALIRFESASFVRLFYRPLLFAPSEIRTSSFRTEPLFRQHLRRHPKVLNRKKKGEHHRCADFRNDDCDCHFVKFEKKLSNYRVV